MAILWRVNPRKGRASLAALLTQRRSTASGGLVGTDEYFGLVGPLETGQGTQTSDISASASDPAGATIETGQGSQTSDIVSGLLSDATIETGQGDQTTDIVATTPFVAAIETGQGDQTTDIVSDLVGFQQVRPTGWLDNANTVNNPGASFWQLNPRTNRISLPAMVVQRSAGQALGSVGTDATFTAVPWTHYSDGFGTQDVSYGIIQVTGVTAGVATSYGTATIYNYNQETYPTGIASTAAFGLPRVENYFRYLEPVGIPISAAFGTATIANLNRELTLTGFSSAQYGEPSIYDPSQPAYAIGFDWLSWGTASVILKDRYLSPTGTKFDGIGTAFIENANREVYPQRIDPPGFGTTTIYNLTQYKAMTGFKDDVFGTAYIVGPRYILPRGWTDDKIRNNTEISNYYRSITFGSLGSVPLQFPVTGTHVVVNKDLFLYQDQGENDFGAIGAPIVAALPVDIIDVLDNSIDESVIGDHDIYYSGRNKIFVRTGISESAYGRPSLFPLTVTVSAGILGTAYGRPTVSNYTRYVSPRSVGDASRYGTQWVSNYIRYVYALGWLDEVVWYEYGPINMDGTYPGVKAGTVYIYPDGFDASGTTYDPCGFPRTPPIPRPYVHP